MGSFIMNIELINMQRKLNCILNQEAINSEIVLCLSQELDKLIIEYYKSLINPEFMKI